MEQGGCGGARIRGAATCREESYHRGNPLHLRTPAGAEARMSRPSRHRPAARILALQLLVAIGLGACRRDPADDAASEPTEVAVIPAQSMANPTAPPPSSLTAIEVTTPDLRATIEAELMATLVALASASPTATATAPAVLGQSALTLDKPEPGCELPTQTLGLSLRVDPAAPQPTAPAVPYFDTYRVLVTEHRAAEGIFRLQSQDPPLPFALELGYGGEANLGTRSDGTALIGAPPPLAVGAVYTITHYDDLHLPQPAGEGLRIDDERGLLVLGVNLRESQGAATRVLGGDRAGWSVETLSSACRFAQLDSCGYERRAAPMRFRRPEGAMAVLSAPGEQLLEAAGAARYRVILATSHLRLWRGDLPCADPADWVQSFRITRED